jgi:hypothetical protein
MIVTLKLDPARSALIRDFMNIYLKLTKAEEVVYHQQLEAIEPAKKRQIVKIVDHITLSEVRWRLVKLSLAHLKHRFGPVPQKVQKIVQLMSIEVLEQLLVAIIDFDDFKEARAWIEQHRESGDS